MDYSKIKIPHGDWRVAMHFQAVWEDNNETICFLANSTADEQSKSRSRLLAAAPDLLRALVAIMTTGYYDTEAGKLAQAAIDKAINGLGSI